MGLTHYWTRPPVLPTAAFKNATEDCLKVLAATGIPLAGKTGQGSPAISNLKIMFNGIDPQGCEPFCFRIFEEPRIPGKAITSYCKTEKMPYDLCVKSALIVLSHYMGDALKVMSDSSDDDWQDARRLCHDCLGYGDDFSLSKNS